MSAIILPNVKEAGDLACMETLDTIERLIPDADEKQADTMLDWLKAFLEVRRVREFWDKASRILRRAEMKWGELHPPRQGDRTDLTSLQGKEVEVNDRHAAEFREMAENPDIVEDVLGRAETEDRKVTRAEVLREIEKAKPHVAQNSGNNEWYTPAEYIEAARAVMGEIDLDPASSATANAKIKAKRFYSEREDGLSARRIWKGRVWMNPPYSGDLVGAFCTKLARHVTSGDVQEAIVLVNNATETQWFCDLIAIASCVCFPSKRVRFWRPDGTFGAPLQGQAIIYSGKSKRAFSKNFQGLGWTANVL